MRKSILLGTAVAMVTFFSCQRFGSNKKSDVDSTNGSLPNVSEIDSAYEDLNAVDVMKSADLGGFLTLKVSAREVKELKGQKYSSFDTQIIGAQNYPGQIFHRAKLLVLERPEHLFASQLTVMIQSVFIAKKVDGGSMVPIVLAVDNPGKKGAAFALESSTTYSTSSTTHTTTSSSTHTTTSSSTHTTTSSSTLTSAPTSTNSTTTSSSVLTTSSTSTRKGACSESKNKDEAVSCCSQYFNEERCADDVEDGCKENPPKWSFCKVPEGSCSEADTEQKALDCCLNHYGPEFCQQMIDDGCDEAKWPFCVGDKPSVPRIEECMAVLAPDPVFGCVEAAIPGGTGIPTRQQMEDCGCKYEGEGELVGGRSIYDCGDFNVSPVPNDGKIGIIIPNEEGCMFDFENRDGEGKGKPMHPDSTDNCFECHDTSDPYIPPPTGPTAKPNQTDSGVFLQLP